MLKKSYIKIQSHGLINFPGKIIYQNCDRRFRPKIWSEISTKFLIENFDQKFGQYFGQYFDIEYFCLRIVYNHLYDGSWVTKIWDEKMMTKKWYLDGTWLVHCLYHLFILQDESYLHLSSNTTNPYSYYFVPPNTTLPLSFSL